MIKRYLSLVKFSHTIFGLPFALVGYAWGVSLVGFNPWTLAAVLLCMVFARNAAMGFNRLIDRRFDEQNPRTASREIPSGVVSVRSARLFVAANGLLFVLSSSLFWVNGLWNPWPLLLAPAALAVILGYSYTKRFTPLCHLVLGVGLAISPSAAFLATTGELHVTVVLLSVAVFFWVSGFDILYALQDREFDRSHKLHSIPAALGVWGSLIVSALLHLCTLLALGYLTHRYIGGTYFRIGLGLFAALLIYQHLIIRPKRLDRIDQTFALVNGIASLLFASGAIADVIHWSMWGHSIS